MIVRSQMVTALHVVGRDDREPLHRPSLECLGRFLRGERIIVSDLVICPARVSCMPHRACRRSIAGDPRRDLANTFALPRVGAYRRHVRPQPWLHEHPRDRIRLGADELGRKDRLRRASARLSASATSASPAPWSTRSSIASGRGRGGLEWVKRGPTSSAS